MADPMSNELKRKRYHEIKAQMKLGVMVPREDFLFVKTIDQVSNGRRFRRYKPYRDPSVYGGFNTVKR